MERAVEIFFSALKRVVGETIMARKLRYQIHEAVMKIYCYFLLSQKEHGGELDNLKINYLTH
jgi:hypothetical protein